MLWRNVLYPYPVCKYRTTRQCDMQSVSKATRLHESDLDIRSTRFVSRYGFRCIPTRWCKVSVSFVVFVRPIISSPTGWIWEKFDMGHRRKSGECNGRKYTPELFFYLRMIFGCWVEEWQIKRNIFWTTNWAAQRQKVGEKKLYFTGRRIEGSESPVYKGREAL